MKIIGFYKINLYMHTLNTYLFLNGFTLDEYFYGI